MHGAYLGSSGTPVLYIGHMVPKVNRTPTPPPKKKVQKIILTLIPLTSIIWRAPNNAKKKNGRMGFTSVSKGLKIWVKYVTSSIKVGSFYSVIQGLTVQIFSPKKNVSKIWPNVVPSVNIILTLH